MLFRSDGRLDERVVDRQDRAAGETEETSVPSSSRLLMRAWAPVSFISLLSLVVVFGEGCGWGARAAGARLGKHDAPRSGEGRRGAHARDGARALRNYEDAGRGTKLHALRIRRPGPRVQRPGHKAPKRPPWLRNMGDPG